MEDKALNFDIAEKLIAVAEGLLLIAAVILTDCDKMVPAVIITAIMVAAMWLFPAVDKLEDKKMKEEEEKERKRNAVFATWMRTKVGEK